MIILLTILNLAHCSLTVNLVQNGSSIGRFNFDYMQETKKPVRTVNSEPIDVEIIGKNCEFRNYKIKQAIHPNKGSFYIEVGSQSYMTQVR